MRCIFGLILIAFVPCSAEVCQAPMKVEQRSFVRLSENLKNTFTWVGEIQAAWFGGIKPFEVYVVSGRVSSPFQAATGSLKREAFLKLTAPDFNTQRNGPLTVTQANAGPGPTLPFRVGNAAYWLKIVSVQPAEGSVTVQVCR